VRLLVFNLAMDLDSDLAFAAQWVGGLAQRVEAVRVITMRAGRVDLPANTRVWSVGKELGLSEPRRAARFYRYLWRAVREDRVDACFSHMIPAFTVLAGPVLRPLGIPLVTWYAHRQLTPTLKLAHHFSDRVVSSSATSYPYRHDKAILVGQGIDTHLFAPGGSTDRVPSLVVSVGRVSPIKDLLTLVEAVEILTKRGSEVQCAIVGDAPDRDVPYREEVRDRIASRGLDDRVRLVGRVSSDQVPTWMRRASVHVNLCPTGAIDKAVLEAMACGTPSMAANEGFAETFGDWTDRLLFRHGDATDLADRLDYLLALPETDRVAMAEGLRQRVVERHSLDQLLDRIVALLGSLRRR
jgi:glycosyltransferase involved in cell wall biosynthesis